MSDAPLSAGVGAAEAGFPASITERLDAGAFVLVDKPRGPSSHQVTAWVRDLFRQPIAGHAGTLDPHVSGLLWVGFGPALKLLPLLLEFPKRYIAVVTFHGRLARSELEGLVAEFTGPLFQTPPVRSAVKRRRRIRVVHALELVEYAPPHALLDALVDSGTYLRSLAVDLGDASGLGAHLSELRRTATGPFAESAACSLVDLTDRVEAARQGRAEPLLEALHPISEVWRAFPQVTLRPGAAAAVAHGADLARGGIRSVSAPFQKGDSVVLLGESGELLALGRALADSTDLPTSGWVIDATRVFADRRRFAPDWRAAPALPP